MWSPPLLITRVWCLNTQKYPHFNTALHWMTDPPLLSRSFVFAPQWYGNSTLSQWDSFLPPPVSLLKAHSHAILPLRDSLEHEGTFFCLVLLFVLYFYSACSVGICMFTVLTLFSIICLFCEPVTGEKIQAYIFCPLILLSGIKYANSYALFSALHEWIIIPMSCTSLSTELTKTDQSK